jgi:hypothetical protein
MFYRANACNTLPNIGVINAASIGMKISRKSLFVLTAVAALSVAYPAKANLITNGGFETGNFTGWLPSPNMQVVGTFLGVSPHSGNFQALLPLASDLEQTLATTPGQSYTVDFWIAVTARAVPLPSSVTVLWGGSPVFSHLFAGPTGYTEFTFNVTASSASTQIHFTYSAILQVMLLDDVSVNPTRVGVPDGGSTVSLLGLALLGLTGLRRRLSC